MSEATTAERLQYIMRTRKLKQVDILEMARPYCAKYGKKLSKNALSQYVNGKVEPRRDMIRLLAETLNVDDAWLTGFDVPMERKAPTPDLSEAERTGKLMELFPKMSPSEQREVILLMERKLSKR